jgi:hypothetical protein
MAMAWTLSQNELVEGVDVARGRTSERRSWRTLELLARALRWDDEGAKSAALFRNAARDVLERIEHPGRGDAMRHRPATSAFAASYERRQDDRLVVRLRSPLQDRLARASNARGHGVSHDSSHLRATRSNGLNRVMQSPRLSSSPAVAR